MDNLVLVTFDSEAKAYQGLSELKELHARSAVALHEAAVVVRVADGGLVVKDSVGFDKDAGAATGSIVGMFIGLLGGPLALLLGWLAGGLIGASTDVVRTAEATSSLAFVGNALPPGSTALIATLTEPTPDALDALFRRLGGQVVRQSAESVHAAIVAAGQAQAAAQESARRAMREKTVGDWKSKWEEIRTSLKRTFASATPPKDGHGAG
jgi:uncharacterized membrane protein